jgi:hypothetical protein
MNASSSNWRVRCTRGSLEFPTLDIFFLAIVQSCTPPENQHVPLPVVYATIRALC